MQVSGIEPGYRKAHAALTACWISEPVASSGTSSRPQAGHEPLGAGSLIAFLWLAARAVLVAAIAAPRIRGQAAALGTGLLGHLSALLRLMQ